MAVYVEQVSYNIPEGATMGKSSTEKISFYGVTPVVLNTVSSGVAVTTIGGAIPVQTAITSVGMYGASTAAIATSTFAQVSALMVDMAVLQALLNNIRTSISNTGLMLGS